MHYANRQALVETLRRCGQAPGCTLMFGKEGEGQARLDLRCVALRCREGGKEHQQQLTTWK